LTTLVQYKVNSDIFDIVNKL